MYVSKNGRAHVQYMIVHQYQAATLLYIHITHIYSYILYMNLYYIRAKSKRVCSRVYRGTVRHIYIYIHTHIYVALYIAFTEGEMKERNGVDGCDASHEQM